VNWNGGHFTAFKRVSVLISDISSLSLTRKIISSVGGDTTS
jgi:hypothetical protein